MLALSSVGVYAVVSQSVQERAGEIWIRLTFGADPRRLFVAELARSGRTIGASVAVGTSIAIAVLRVLASRVEGFGAPAGLPLALSACTLVALALIATALPAARVVRRGVTAPSAAR